MTTIVHSWDLSPKEARMLQDKLAGRVVRQADLGPVTTVAGVDASYKAGLARAAVVALSYPDLEVLDYARADRPVDFPYAPGLLSFREGPAVLEALERLEFAPDLLIFDGQGVAHPRRFGLACHIGLLAGIPSIGCAKSRLMGQYREPDRAKGSYSLLRDGVEVIGAVVRTRSAVKPVFVSIGHRVDLQTSISYVLGCCRTYRLPETTRWAHRVASDD